MATSLRAHAHPPLLKSPPLCRLSGAALVGWALFLLLALLSYDPADPSPNHSTLSGASNIAGMTGAYVADVALQVLGLAAVMAIFVPLSWGVKLIRGEEVGILWLRTCLLLVSMVFLSVLLSLIEPPMSWPIASGFGGSLGSLLGAKFKGALGNPLVTAILLGSCIVMLAIAFGMSLSEWQGVGRGMHRVGVFGYALVATAKAQAMRRERARYEEDEDEEEYEEDGEDVPQPWHERLKERVTGIFSRNRAGEEEEEEFEDGDEDEEEDEEEEETPARSKRTFPGRNKKVPVSVDKAKKTAARAQAALQLPVGDYVMPPLGLLTAGARSRKNTMNESSLQQNARLLEKVLNDFGVHGNIIAIRPGPVVTLYELEPAAGTKSSRVVGLSDDIARSMSAVSARIAVIPGRNAIGIELPNTTRETVLLREMMESEAFGNMEAKLPLALGKDIGGAPIITDLARMPHLLVAGTTGSGKSVAINTMIMSLVYRLTPEECKFIMIDPKMLELSVYDGIPHLLSPVVTEPGKAVVALKWTVKEMENRYRLMSNLGVRNIDGYNKKIREARARGQQLSRSVQTGFDPETGEPIMETQELDMTELPYIVVIVDEMADLMIVAGKEIEGSIQRLAQMARAAGIHIIMATQRPSVDVITGVIKANFPTRISFQVTSRIDSRTILGEQGAEQLLGQGDMLYMAGGGRITRVHGPFVSDKEVEEVVAHLKEQGEPSYIEDVTRDEEAEMGEFGEEGEKDEMYDEAVAIVARDRKASTSYIQRCLKIGYNRAASIIERMEREGVVSAANHVGKREVLVREED